VARFAPAMPIPHDLLGTYPVNSASLRTSRELHPRITDAIDGLRQRLENKGNDERRAWSDADMIAGVVRDYLGCYAPEELERSYQLIGWRKGPFSSPTARKAIRDFWVASGSHGASWLARRIAAETHGDILEGVANLLADIGASSIEPIIRALDTGLGRDQVEVLLKALGWIEAPHNAAIADPNVLEGPVEKYLSDSDPDIREAACSATAILPRDRAISLLCRRRELERDSSVLGAIDEALQDRR
jgi:hypothetical protein